MDKLIYDRTSYDIKFKTEKGYYNVKDIQRINSYIRYLSSALNLNLEVIDLNLGEALTKSKIQAIINNVNAIRDVWYVAEDTPQTPLPVMWNYSKANAMEKILQSLYDFLISVKTDKIYSGTFKAGHQIKFRGQTL